METLWLWVLSSEVAIIILLLITLVHLKLSTPAEVCVEGSASTVLSTPPAEATLEVIPDQQLSHAMKTIRELVSEDQLLDAGLLLMRLQHTQRRQGLAVQPNTEEVRPGLTCATVWLQHDFWPSTRCAALRALLRCLSLCRSF